MYSTYTYLCLWYESLNSDGKQSKHISKTNNHLRALTTTQNTQTTMTYDLGNPGLYVCMYKTYFCTFKCLFKIDWDNDDHVKSARPSKT